MIMRRPGEENPLNKKKKGREGERKWWSSSESPRKKEKMLGSDLNHVLLTAKI